MADKPDEVELLLPWYVNGTLNAEQKKRVENWIRNNRQGQQDKQMYEQLQEQIQNNVQHKGPGEFGWKRLQRQLHRQAEQQRSSWYRPALVAAIALIVVQSSVLVYNFKTESYNTPWKTLSGGFAQPVLQIMFQPQATEQQVRYLLQQYQLNIVDGPSAIGLYRVRFSRDGQQSLQEVAELLSKQKDIVRHVAVE